MHNSISARVIFAIVATFLMTIGSAAEPVKISGTLDPEQQTFDGLVYDVFEVVTDGPTVMAVLSDAQGLDYIAYFQNPNYFQAAFQLDWISDDLHGQGYRGDVTPDGLAGTWLFFIVAQASQDAIPFEAYFENAISVSEIEPSQIDDFDLIAAFDQIGVLDKDASQRVSVPFLSNMLASLLFRRQMIGEFARRLFESSEELEGIELDLEEAEHRSAALRRALDDLTGVGERQTVVAETLGSALQIEQADMEISELLGVELLALQDDLLHDLAQLREIDALADPNGDQAQFLRLSFASRFLDNAGEVSVRVTGRYRREAPVFEIDLPTYLPDSGADIMEAPVIVEETSGIGGGGSVGAMAEWDSDDWNGSAFVKQKDIFRATHRVVVKRDLLVQAAKETIGKDSVDTLGDASAILTEVLGAEGFTDLSYQGIENDASGFILATGLDQTDANGVPLEGELRNSINVVKIKDRSLSGYLRALFTSEPGYFRAILFLVSAEQYTNNGPSADFKTMQIWSDNSLKGRLPDQVSARTYSDKHEITALIYEFRKVTAPEFIDKTRSNIQARAHFSTTQRIKNHLSR